MKLKTRNVAYLILLLTTTLWSQTVHLTEWEQELGIPDTFPEVGTTYTGVIHKPYNHAEFEFQVYDSETQTYYGEFFSSNVDFSLVGDIFHPYIQPPTSAKFSMRRDPSDQWKIEVHYEVEGVKEVQSVRWIRTSYGPALIGNVRPIKDREMFLISPFTHLKPIEESHAFVERSIEKPKVVSGGTVRRLTSSDGLANNATRCITQTSDGAIWVGTVSGLSRYDGLGFTNFHPNSSPALPDENVRALLELQDGRLAVGTKSLGVFFFDGEQFSPTPLTRTFEDSTRPIQDIRQTDDGSLWVVDYLRVYCLRPDGSIRSISVDEVNPNYLEYNYFSNNFGSLVPFDTDSVLLTTSESLIRWAPWGSKEDEFLYCGRFGTYFSNLASLHNGMFVWYNWVGRRMVNRDLRIVKTVDIRSEDPRTLINQNTSKGGYWFYENKFDAPDEDDDQYGMFRHEPPLTFGYSSFPKNLNSVQEWIEDRNGNLWVATGSEGVYFFNPPFVMNIEKTGRSPRFVDVESQHTIREANNYQLHELGLFPKEIHEYLAENNASVGLFSFLYQPLFQKHHENSEALETWFFIDPVPMNINFVEGSTPIPRTPVLVNLSQDDHADWYYNADPEFKFNTIQTAGLSAASGLFLGTNSGLLYMPPGDEEIHLWSALYPSTIPEDAINAIWVDTEENVWIATDNSGLFLVRSEEGTGLTDVIRLPLEQKSIKTVYQTSDQSIWVCSADLMTRIRLEGNGFEIDSRRFPHRDNSYDNPAHSAVVEDNEGFLWFGFGHGIQGYRLTDLHLYMENQTETPDQVLLDEESGLANVSTEVNFYPASGKDENGILHFNMMDYMSSFDPKKVIARASTPKASILRMASGSDIYYENVYISASKEVVREFQLPPKAGKGLSFDFSAFSPTPNPIRKPQYQFRLIGHSEEWSDFSPFNSAFFPQLPPGKYRFEVKASSASGFRQKDPTSITLFIQPHYYQTLAFQSGIILALFAVIAVCSWRWDAKRRLELEFKNQLELEDERLRITRHMHDDLGASMARMKMQIELAAKDPDFQNSILFKELHQFFRESTEKLRNFIWYTSSDNSTFQSFCDYMCHVVTQYLQNTDISVDLSVTDVDFELRLKPEQKRECILMIKNLLMNVLQHSGASHVRFAIQVVENQKLEFQITDDGVGFDTEKASDKTGSTGLRSIRERVEKQGGDFKIESQPGAGSKVSIRIPF